MIGAWVTGAMMQVLGARADADLPGQVAAIVRCNRGRVNYRMLSILTLRPASVLRPIVKQLGAEGWIR